MGNGLGPSARGLIAPKWFSTMSEPYRVRCPWAKWLYLVCMYLALGSFPERDARERILCFCVVSLCLRGLSGKDCLSLEACPLVHHVHPEKGLRGSSVCWVFIIYLFFYQHLFLGHQEKFRRGRQLCCFVVCLLAPECMGRVVCAQFFDISLS